MMKQDICPLGCGFWRKTKSCRLETLEYVDEISEMRKHFILYHSHKQLKSWGINRNYLKYLEGMITKDEMRKDINSDFLKQTEPIKKPSDNPYNRTLAGPLDKDGYEVSF
jgi:hypothetical protein